MNYTQRIIFSVASVLFLGFGFTTQSDARPNRPSLIPNGTVNNCANCHINPAGGGARNPFGQAVEQLIFSGAGEDFWGEELAMMDSDDDGFTNGEELLNPEGTWRPGDPDPGDPENITLPGDAESTPTVELNAYAAYLHGTNVVPTVDTQATGKSLITINEQSMTLNYHLYVYNIDGVSASHIPLGERGVSGGVIFPLADSSFESISSEIEINNDQLDNLLSHEYYFMVYTQQNPGGEIRGQILFDREAFFDETLIDNWLLFEN